jgi:hypothetical protein
MSLSMYEIKHYQEEAEAAGRRDVLAELERAIEKRKKYHGGGKYFDCSGNELSDDKKDEDDWFLTLIRSKKGGA